MLLGKKHKQVRELVQWNGKWNNDKWKGSEWENGILLDWSCRVTKSIFLAFCLSKEKTHQCLGFIWLTQISKLLKCKKEYFKTNIGNNGILYQHWLVKTFGLAVSYYLQGSASIHRLNKKLGNNNLDLIDLGYHWSIFTPCLKFRKNLTLLYTNGICIACHSTDEDGSASSWNVGTIVQSYNTIMRWLSTILVKCYFIDMSKWDKWP